MSTNWTPQFLVKLGLDANADAREVRRAYAQRLKQIDQAADPDGFQALRTAYESALTWLARRVPTEEAQQPQELQAAPEELAPQTSEVQAPTATQQSTAAPEADLDPRRLGDLVFAELSAKGFVATEAQIRQRLGNALADPKLINIEARTWFEWRVASLLLDGWQAGHHVLFVSASQVFNWDEDRRRLTLFGRAGAVLDAAIREKLTFHSQGTAKTELQRRLIQDLRLEQIPSAKQLIHAVPSLQELMQRYPHWLRIIAPYSHYLQWVAAFEAIPGAAPIAKSDATVPTAASKRTRFRETLWFCLLMLVLIGAMLAGGGGKEHPQPLRSTRASHTNRPPQAAPSPSPSPAASEPLKLLPITAQGDLWMGNSDANPNGTNFPKLDQEQKNAYGLPPVNMPPLIMLSPSTTPIRKPSKSLSVEPAAKSQSASAPRSDP